MGCLLDAMLQLPLLDLGHRPPPPLEDHLSLLFEATEDGTVFFREIGAMPSAAQEELVGILKMREEQTVGPDRSGLLTARVIASSSAPLEQMAETQSFNPELYRCLRGTILLVPPLRERKEDVRVHIGLMLRQIESKPGDLAPIEPDALMILEKYPWPGNLPELAEVIRNASSMAKGGQISVAHLPRSIVSRVTLTGNMGARRVDLQEFKGRFVKSFLQQESLKESAAAVQVQ